MAQHCRAAAATSAQRALLHNTHPGGSGSAAEGGPCTWAQCETGPSRLGGEGGPDAAGDHDPVVLTDKEGLTPLTPDRDVRALLVADQDVGSHLGEGGPLVDVYEVGDTTPTAEGHRLSSHADRPVTAQAGRNRVLCSMETVLPGTLGSICH